MKFIVVINRNLRLKDTNFSFITDFESNFEYIINLLYLFIIIFKYTIIIVLLFLGILSFIEKINANAKNRCFQEDYSKKDNKKYWLGILYLFLGLGFLFNYLIFFLIWLVNLLPDGLLIQYFEKSMVLPLSSSSKSFLGSNLERTIIIIISLGSLYGILNLIISIWFLFQFKNIKNPKVVIIYLIHSLFFCIIFGFTAGLKVIL
ncbi:MAG: hypothetical protein ACTSVV_05110 [Promethearchaeota archaeon]